MAKRQANKRTKAQVEWDRIEAIRLYLRGKSQMEIVDILNSSRAYTLSQQQVSYDLKKVREEWKESRNEEIDAQKAEELARLDELEREAWGAYGLSGNIEEIDSNIQETDRKSRRPGNWRYLAVVHSCIVQRSRIKGINAPEKFARTNKEGTEDIPPLSEEERQAEIGALLGLARERAAKGHPSPADDTNDE